MQGLGLWCKPQALNRKKVLLETERSSHARLIAVFLRHIRLFCAKEVRMVERHAHWRAMEHWH